MRGADYYGEAMFTMTLGGIACRLQIPLQRGQHFILLQGLFFARHRTQCNAVALCPANRDDSYSARRRPRALSSWRAWDTFPVQE